MLFRFELHPLDRIEPWGEPPSQTLSWFALTDGLFHIDTGVGKLCRYMPERADPDTGSVDVDYQIASIVDDVLGCFAEAVAPLPGWAEELAGDWSLLTELQHRWAEEDDFYAAFRWVGERSPWLSYLNSAPRFSFLRVGDEIVLGWDARECILDGREAWEPPRFGSVRLAVADFTAECHSFGARLLDAMRERIDAIEAGAKAQIELDAADLRRQHEEWVSRIDTYLSADYTPDLPWLEAEEAMARLRARGI